MMKPKKMALMTLLALGMVAVLAVGAYAAEATYTCKVVAAGPVTKIGGVATNIVQFKLTRVVGTPVFTAKTAKAATGQEKQMLAVALTAMANGKNVDVLFDPDLAGNPVIYNMQLK